MNQATVTRPSRVRVLLVEDSPDILFVMSAELESLGYDVDVASDAAHGLEIISARRPDVIISDVNMPGISGLDFIQRLRQNPLLATIPAIALTGFSMDTEIKSILEQGFSAHLLKPVEPEELIAVIRDLTDPKRLTKAS